MTENEKNTERKNVLLKEKTILFLLLLLFRYMIYLPIFMIAVTLPSLLLKLNIIMKCAFYK